MHNPLWLMISGTQWFFEAILFPLRAGLLTLVPTFGILCLIGGLFYSAFRPQKKLFLFFVPFAVSEVFLALAGVCRGIAKHDQNMGGFLVIGFLVVEILMIGFLVYRSKGTRSPAILLALFCLTYALHAAFVGGMSLSDDWL